MSVSPDPRLRGLPSVERVLQHLEAMSALDGVPRSLAAACVRQVIDEAREGVLAGAMPPDWTPDAVIPQAARAVAEAGRPSLVHAINATGILIHTNLGRAPLSAAAGQAVRAILEGYSLLEIDPETGERGSRQAHVERLLRTVTGAEAALAVNNNAAAVLLALSALSAGGDVLVSRGELVEIGGAFRMPDVMAQSGARLVEVGTTNKTRLTDYERAVTDRTRLLLKVHRSNFTMTGFVEEVDPVALAAFSRERGIPVLFDLGSGAVVDLRERGGPYEPTVQEAVAAGCDLVTFSGDKLLGGPQAGLLVGRSGAVARCRNHPLARAVRIDRLSLAALAATLHHYLVPGEAWEAIPVLRMLAADVRDLTNRAAELARALQAGLGKRAHVTVTQVEALAGGGTLPGGPLPSVAVAVRPREATAEAWAAGLRRHRPPVIARIRDDNLLLDVRTILPEELSLVADALAAVAATSSTT